MDRSGNMEGNNAPQQQIIIPILQNFEEIIDSAIAGRTSAQLSSDVRSVLAGVDPHTKQILTAILYFVVAKINGSVAKMEAHARDVHGHMDELNTQVLRTHEFAIKQAIDNTESHDNYVKATDRLNEATYDKEEINRTVDNRCRRTEEQGSTALKVANLARDSFKYWDRGVMEELEEMFNRRMPVFEAHLQQKFANQLSAAGGGSAEAHIRELAERFQALENSLRQDLANQAQNMDGYLQRELAQQQKAVKKLEEKVEAHEKKNKAQDKEIEALKAKVDALMNMRG